MNIKFVAILLVALIVIASVITLYPVKVDAVNDPVSGDEATPDNPATIAWVKIDASFRFGIHTDCVFNVMTVSKGQYFGDGTDIPTLSLWESLTLGGGYYLWQFDFVVMAPDGTIYSQNVTQGHDLPAGGESLVDTMGVLYISQVGEYSVTMKLRAIDYQVDATGEVLATGTRTFTIPTEWLTSPE